MTNSCDHRTLRWASGHEEPFHCADCGQARPDPRGCLHPRVDNDTEQCVECAEPMIARHKHEMKVLSAPNKAACANPDCSGDIDDPHCSNPDGLYVPDTEREREVLIWVDYTYTCQRCRYDDVTYTHDGVVWGCGRDHRGDRVPIRDGMPA